MIFLPVDLFGSYLQGKRQAVDDNWSDLKNYGQVEQQYLNNDNQQLRNWFAQDTYGNNLNLSNAQTQQAMNAATRSGYDTQIAGLAQPGRVAQAQFQSDYDTNLANNMFPQIPQLAANQAGVTADNSATRAAQAHVTSTNAADIARSNIDTGLSNNRYTSTRNDYATAHFAEDQDAARTQAAQTRQVQQQLLLERQRQNDIQSRQNWAAQNPGQPYPGDAPVTQQPVQPATPQAPQAPQAAPTAQQPSQAQLDAIPNGTSAVINGVTYYRMANGQLVRG